MRAVSVAQEDQRGRGVAGKVPAFGPLKQEGKVDARIIEDAPP